MIDMETSSLKNSKVLKNSKEAPILITGAGGFLGAEIARQGLAKGFKIRGIARGKYPEMSELGVEMIQGDIGNLNAVVEATGGCQAVFHVAALAGAWGKYEDYFHSNVKGTQNIIEACKTHKIPRLIFTSSPSVIHQGGDIEGKDESLPYPEHYTAHYPATKAEAERLALAANSETLSTVSLRPHLIWGPGDRHLIPRILDRADRGRLRYLAPHKKVDSVYITDAASAHWSAYDCLNPKADCAGRAYFISQDEPWEMKSLMDGILEAHGRKAITKTIHPRIAYSVGFLFELIYRLFKIEKEPVMTRFIAEQLSTAHWYDISAARRDLNYTPQYTIKEGLALLKKAHQASLSA